MSQWYYSHDGKQSGPVPDSELQRLAADGDFDPEKDLVWREGQPDWKPASTVPELESLFRKESPAEPVAAATAAAASPNQAPQSPAGPASHQAPAAQMMQPPSSGLAVASLICGLVGLLSCFIWCLSIPLAIAAIVTGHLSSSKIKSDPTRFTGKGLAKTGLITGYLGMILSIVFVVGVNYMVSLSPERLEELGLPQEFIEQMESQQRLRDELQQPSE